MTQFIKHLWSWLFAIFVIGAAGNVFWQIPLGSAYVQGLRIDYLIPKLYASWALLTVWIGLTLWLNRRQVVNSFTTFTQTRGWWLVAIGIGLLLTRQYFTAYPLAAVQLLGWLLTVVVAVGVIRWQLAKLPALFIRDSLVFSLGWVVSLALWQIIAQRPLAPYWVFGETSLQSWAGIAHGTWFAKEIILPYGPSAHPNILANTIVVLWWLATTWWLPNFSITKKATLFWWLGLTGASLGVVITTQSISGLAATVIAGWLWLRRFAVSPPPINTKLLWLGALLTPFGLWWLTDHTGLAQDYSWLRRRDLFTAGLSILPHQWWWGTGLNQAVVALTTIGGNKEVVRFIQPIHHVFWQSLIEFGVMGWGILGGVWWWWRRTYPTQITALIEVSLLLLPAVTLDHFWFTQWPALAIVILLWGLTNPPKTSRPH